MLFFNKSPVKEITVQELNQKRQAAQPLHILDVREDYEREICKIGSDVHIPMGTIKERLSELAKDQPWVVYCKGGVRSMRVAKYLASEGFNEVYNLKGGIDAWAKEIDPTMARY